MQPPFGADDAAARSQGYDATKRGGALHTGQERVFGVAEGQMLDRVQQQREHDTAKPSGHPGQQDRHHKPSTPPRRFACIHPVSV